MHCVVLHCLKKGVFVLLAMGISWLGTALAVQAENGSSQALMSLVVPANEFNTITHQKPNRQASQAAEYDPDTKAIMLQQTRGVTCQIWMEL